MGIIYNCPKGQRRDTKMNTKKLLRIEFEAKDSNENKGKFIDYALPQNDDNEYITIQEIHGQKFYQVLSHEGYVTTKNWYDINMVRIVSISLVEE